MTITIEHMTAFTRDPAGGNPAGVVLDATGLDEQEMLAIAADLGYSESAFLAPGRRGHRLRYFSPRAEVAFCGHATVATAVALAHRDGVGPVEFDTPAGPVPVRTDVSADGAITATLTSPPGRSAPATPELVRETLAALQWSEADLDLGLPPHVAHAGNDHLVLATHDRHRLARLDYDVAALERVMHREGLTTVHLTWQESPTVFHARDPFPTGGVYEDPATGAAAAAFGAYLQSLNGPADRGITIHQGVDMGRPSVLQVTTAVESSTVEVTGTAVSIPG